MNKATERPNIAIKFKSAASLKKAVVEEFDLSQVKSFISSKLGAKSSIARAWKVTDQRNSWFILDDGDGKNGEIFPITCYIYDKKDEIGRLIVSKIPEAQEVLLEAAHNTRTPYAALRKSKLPAWESLVWMLGVWNTASHSEYAGDWSYGKIEEAYKARNFEEVASLLNARLDNLREGEMNGGIDASVLIEDNYLRLSWWGQWTDERFAELFIDLEGENPPEFLYDTGTGRTSRFMQIETVVNTKIDPISWVVRRRILRHELGEMGFTNEEAELLLPPEKIEVDSPLWEKFILLH